MKVKNIVFTGFMAAILGATSANAAIQVASKKYVDDQVGTNAAAIAEITKVEGTIDTKVAAAVAPLATSQSVTDLETTVSTTYQTKADAASQHEALQTAINSKVAQATYDAKMGALDAMDDTFATKTFVGALPQGATATSIVGYIQEKTSGIATESAMTELGGRVKQVEDSLKEGGETANAIAAALKAGEDAQADADTNAAAILAINNAENGILAQAKADATSKANAAEAAAKQYADGLAGNYAAKSLEDTVSSQGGKITALEGQLAEGGATAQAIAAAKSAADAAQVAADTAQDAADAAQADADTNAAAILAINNAENGILAQAKSYTDTQDAATLADAKTYADGKAAEEAGKVADTLNALATAEGLETCQAASGTCVLSYNGTAFAWTPLTAPVE